VYAPERITWDITANAPDAIISFPRRASTVGGDGSPTTTVGGSEEGI